MSVRSAAYNVREADVTSDRSRIIEGLRRYLNPLTDERRFEWLYLQNPDGPPRIWIAEDANGDEILGSCATLPREFVIGGSRVRGCVIADSWIHPDYRFLGPALKLHKACFTAISDDGYRLAYDFPRKSMIAVYRRLRLEPRDHLTDFVKLVRSEAFLANRIGNHIGSRMLSAMVNPLLQALDGRVDARRYSVRLEEGCCGHEYTELFDRHAREAGQTEICVARKAEYLNWRYRNHFHQRHEFLVAREAGRLAGYLVFVHDPVRTLCVDLVHAGDNSLPRLLLLHLVAELRRRGSQSLAFPLLASDPLAKRLRAVGFRPLGATPVIVVASHELAPKIAEMRVSLKYGDESD